MGGTQSQGSQCLSNERLFAAASGRRVTKAEVSHIAYCKTCGYLYGTRSIANRRRQRVSMQLKVTAALGLSIALTAVSANFYYEKVVSWRGETIPLSEFTEEVPGGALNIDQWKETVDIRTPTVRNEAPEDDQSITRFGADFRMRFSQNDNETQMPSWVIPHEVKRGDRLAKLVADYYNIHDPKVVTMVARFARLDNQDMIRVGTVLYLPSREHLEWMIKNGSD